MELAEQKICDLTEKEEFKSCNKDHDDDDTGGGYEDNDYSAHKWELDADGWEWWPVSMRKNVDDMVGLDTGDLCPDWGGGVWEVQWDGRAPWLLQVIADQEWGDM